MKEKKRKTMKEKDHVKEKPNIKKRAINLNKYLL